MKTKHATFGRLLAAAGLILSLAAGPVALAQSSVDLHGWVGTQYRFRATDSAQDQDIHQYLNLDLNNDSASVSGHFFGRLTADIDGNQGSEEFYPFASIYDSYDNPVVGHLYIAHLDLNRVPGMKKIRLGRMANYDAPVPIYIDGAYAETAEWKDAWSLSAGGYVGSPVHFFETDTEEDLTYGAWLQTRPWQGSRIRADYVHVEDQNFYGDMNDDFSSVSLWQQLGQYARIHAFYSRLENVDRDLQVDASYFNPKADFMLMVSYYELLEAQEFHTIDFDPLYAALFTYYPYRQIRVMASKGLGENFFVEGGVDSREVKDERYRSDFNHDFNRYYATVGMRGLPEGLTATASYEVWDSNEQIERIDSVSGDLSYARDKSMKLSLGSYYALYKFDYYTSKEEERVQTYYARLRLSPVENLGLDLGYEYEDGDYEDFQTMKLGFRYSF